MFAPNPQDYSVNFLPFVCRCTLFC